MLRRVARALLAVALILTITAATAWAGLALWYRLPAPEVWRALGAAMFILLGLSAVIALFGRFRLPAVLAFAVAFAGVLAWWSMITPPDRGDWAPDVARQVTGTLSGDLLTLTNVRDFEWRSNSDYHRALDDAQLRPRNASDR